MTDHMFKIEQQGIHSHKILLTNLEDVHSTLRKSRDPSQISTLSRQLFDELKKNELFLKEHFKRYYFSVQYPKAEVYLFLERFKKLCDAVKDLNWHAPLKTLIAHGMEAFVKDYGMMVSMDVLPDEIRLKIIKDLDYKDLLSISRTCRQLNSLFKDDTVWRKIALQCGFNDLIAAVGAIDLVKSRCLKILQEMQTRVVFKRCVEGNLATRSVRYESPFELVQQCNSFATWALISRPLFSHVQNLRTGLSRFKITVLPPEIKFFTNLQILSLSFNALTNLPQEIGELTNLRELAVDYNRLHNLPQEIGGLISLKRLNLARNKLTVLPSTISRLTALENLDLQQNELSSLSSEIQTLLNLQELDISQNKLEKLPSSIGSCRQLINLNLKNNQLTELPPSFTQLTALKVLNLAFNPFVYTPDIPLKIVLSKLIIDKSQSAYSCTYLNDACAKGGKFVIDLHPH